MEGERVTWSPEDAYDLAGATAIVGDGYHVVEGAFVCFSNMFKDINEVVCRAAAGEDDNAALVAAQGGFVAIGELEASLLLCHEVEKSAASDLMIPEIALRSCD